MSSNQYIHVRSMYMTVKVPGVPVNHSLDETIIMSAVPYSYHIAVIFRGYKFSRMDHYKGFRAFFFVVWVPVFWRMRTSTCSCTSTPLASNPGLAYNGEAPLLSIDVVNNTKHAYYLVGINFRGTGSIRKNREHLYPRNIPAIRYANQCFQLLLVKTPDHTTVLVEN